MQRSKNLQIDSAVISGMGSNTTKEERTSTQTTTYLLPPDKGKLPKVSKHHVSMLISAETFFCSSGTTLGVIFLRMQI